MDKIIGETVYIVSDDNGFIDVFADEEAAKGYVEFVNKDLDPFNRLYVTERIIN